MISTAQQSMAPQSSFYAHPGRIQSHSGLPMLRAKRGAYSKEDMYFPISSQKPVTMQRGGGENQRCRISPISQA